MEYIVESSLENFQAWSGGKSTLETIIKKGDCDAVEQFFEEIFCDHTPTETEINDVLWFEPDTIAEHLGYRDWDAYEEGWSESDLEEAEDWFEGLDLDEMEEVSGLDRDGYRDPEAMLDEEKFIDTVEEWWNGLSDKRKVEVYYEHN